MTSRMVKIQHNEQKTFNTMSRHGGCFIVDSDDGGRDGGGEGDDGRLPLAPDSLCFIFASPTACLSRFFQAT